MHNDTISQIFLTIFSLALLMWVTKYVFILWYQSRQKEYINKLEARVAVMRMLLKTKLKAKGSRMQEQYKSDKKLMDMIISKLEMLTTYNFHRVNDYEDVINILTSINDTIEHHDREENPTKYLMEQKALLDEAQKHIKLAEDAAKEIVEKGQQGESAQALADNDILDFGKWKKLIQTDKGTIYIIKEIIETTLELKLKIDIYNTDQENKNLQLRAPEIIAIEDFESLKKIVDRDKAKSLNNKKNKKAQSIDPSASEDEAA